MQQGVELVVDLRLAGRADLVVLALDLQARLGEFQGHLGAQVGEVVDRRDGEVAALVLDLVAADVALGGTGVPGAGLGVDVVVRGVGAGVEPDRVEDVELGLGAEERGVRDAGGGEVGLGLLGDVARVAAVGLAGHRVLDEEVDVEVLLLAERVEPGGGEVGDQGHVGLVDGLEAADRRAVEHQGLGRVERRRGYGEVLQNAWQVAEADIDELHVVVLDELLHFGGVVEHPSSSA